MRSTLKVSFMLAVGLALMPTWLSTQAQGGIVLGNPVVVSGGDPWYIYTVPVYFDPQDIFSPASGPNFLNPVDPSVDDFITLYNVRGFTNVVGFFSDEDWTQIITGFTGIGRAAGTGYTPLDQMAPPVDPYPDVADVTLHAVRGYDPVINMTSMQALLGYFVIQAQLPTGVEPSMSFDYTWQIRNLGTGTGSGSGAIMVIPEPSSMVLLGLGVLALRSLACQRPRRPERIVTAQTPEASPEDVTRSFTR